MLSYMLTSARDYGTFPKRYTLLGRLAGHTEGVNCLAVNQHGTRLASGGSDGPKLWDLQTMKKIDTPNRPDATQITAVVWTTPPGTPWESLCFGTAGGSIVLWQESKMGFTEESRANSNSLREVTALAWDPSPKNKGDGLLAVGERDGSVSLWTISDDKNQLSLQWCTCAEANVIPRTVAFVGQMPKDVLVIGINGRVSTLCIEDGEEKCQCDITRMARSGQQPIIGEADILSEGGRIVVDNTTSGFEFHRLDKLGNYLLYRTGPSREPALPRQVKFGEDGNVVVGGSDHGTVYVFDRKGGHTLELLRHRRNDMVQTVTTHSTPDGKHYIISADSRQDKEALIYVWRYTNTEIQDKTSSRWPTMWSLGLCAFGISLILGATPFKMDCIGPVNPVKRIKDSVNALWMQPPILEEGNPIIHPIHTPPSAATSTSEDENELVEEEIYKAIDAAREEIRLEVDTGMKLIQIAIKELEQLAVKLEEEGNDTVDAIRDQQGRM